jgi:hypothetical protein
MLVILFTSTFRQRSRIFIFILSYSCRFICGFFLGRLPPRPPYSAAPGPVLHSLCSIDWKVWNTHECSESVKYYKFEIVIFNFVLQDSIYTIATSNNGLSHKYRNKLRRRAAGVTVLMIRNRKSYKENFQQFLIYILPCNINKILLF